MYIQLNLLGVHQAFARQESVVRRIERKIELVKAAKIFSCTLAGWKNVLKIIYCSASRLVDD